MSWSQSQPSWHGPQESDWTYTCEGTIPARGHGSSATASGSSTERTGSARFVCNDGSWEAISESCDGRLVLTESVLRVRTTCSDPDPVRSMWISWYRADLKRCADVEGLNWWVTQYNANAGCRPENNYDGYGSRNACWREHFRDGANSNGNSYDEATETGHISSWDENNICGSLAYTWTNVSSYGTYCKYRP